MNVLLHELGLQYRRIKSPSEIKENEYGIVLYHYFYEVNYFFDEEIHLARIEKDGTWTHKFGWDYDASITNPQEIHDTILEDDNVDVTPEAYFAVRKP